MRLSLMQEDRFAAIDREFKLSLKGLALGRTRGEVAEIVQATFADGDHFRRSMQLTENARRVGGKVRSQVRMHAGGGGEAVGPLLSEFQRFDAAVLGRTRNDHVGDADTDRIGDDLVAIPVEAVVGEITADVDQFHGRRL